MRHTTPATTTAAAPIHVRALCHSPRQGIRQIQNLEEYTGLRVIWLEGNGLCKLEGMEAQTQMKTLYAHENLIEKIEGLDSFLEASGVVQ